MVSLQTENKTSILRYLSECANVLGPANNDSDTKILSKSFSYMQRLYSVDSALSTYINPRKSPITKSPLRQLIFPFGCNSSQYKAVYNALHNSFSVIQGPPGTGKTQTILNIISNIIIDGKNVLVVSQNNNAVANIQEKLAQPKYGLDFLVARLGCKENIDSFILDQCEQYPADMQNWLCKIDKKIISKRCDGLKNFFEQKEEIARLNLEIINLETEYKYFLENKKVENEYNLNHLAKRSSQDLWDLLKRLENYGRKKERLSNLVKFQLWAHWGIGNKRFWKTKENAVFILLKEMLYVARRAELSKRINALENKCETIDPISVYDDSLRFFKSFVAQRMLRRKKRIIFTQESWSKRIGEFVREYPITLSTTFSSRNAIFYQKDFLFDYVIVDEASQVDVVTGALTMSCARNIVVVGDANQLPNVIPETIKEKIKQLFCNYQLPKAYCATNSFLDSVSKVLLNVPTTLLREHYRCHPKIINFCNQKFYNNQLIIMTRDKGERDVLEIIRTPKGNHCRERLNQREIDVIHDDVLAKLRPDEICEMGVITPYNNQANAIFSQLHIDASTVHKYQGREKDVILFSTTDNQVSSFSDDPNLMNVAISRAKKKLIIVTTGNDLPQNSNLADLIGYVEYNGFKVQKSSVNSIFDCLYSQYNDQKKMGIMRISKYESENLMYELLVKVLNKPKYNNLKVLFEVPLKDVLGMDKLSLLTHEECVYAMNDWTHIDFSIYNKLTKRLVCAVEVDGYQYHKKGTRQSKRDVLKNSIFEKYGICYARFSTTGSNEEMKIEKLIDRALSGAAGQGCEKFQKTMTTNKAIQIKAS